MLSGKKVLVLGLAKSGKAAISLLQKAKANITVNASDRREDIAEYDEYIKQGVRMVCGGHPLELFEEDFDMVIKNPGINYQKDFVLRLKQRNIPVYTEIELAYQIAKKQNYIALTGTNGKTTTVTLIYDILKSKYKNVHLAGNIGTPLCEIVDKFDLDIHENHYIVLEMSNFQLLDIDKFTPTVSTILNLTPDHLDYMATLEEYYISKTRIYENQLDGYYVVNQDDTTLQEYLSKVPPKCPTLSFSLTSQGDCMYYDNAIYYKGECIINKTDIKVVGNHNIQNIMASICIAKAMNVDTKTINEVVSQFRGVEHRIEHVRNINGVDVYNDSKATNTDATIIALKAFEKPVILLVGGFDKGLDMTVLQPYRDNIKQVITFGAARERFKDELQVENTVVIETLEQATKYALENAMLDDIILLSPATSSFDEFSGYQQRGDYFKKIVTEF